LTLFAYGTVPFSLESALTADSYATSYCDNQERGLLTALTFGVGGFVFLNGSGNAFL